MIRLDSPGAMTALARGWAGSGAGVGLVPTMGALHEGHLSLVRRSRAENDLTVVSIFVNPLQFGPGEDLSRYPRPLDRDLELLGREGVDAVYLPDEAAMYPPQARTRVSVGGVSEPLEGAHRPGHFDGVATVVTKLFATVRPNRAYFGQKDAQQLAVVRRLAADLDTGVEIRACPIVREPDGLAMSSRNAYLTPEERRAATCLHRALIAAAAAYRAGERDPDRLSAVMREVIGAEPLAELDYAAVVDPASFTPPGHLALVAARLGSTRLIDNLDLAAPAPG